MGRSFIPSSPSDGDDDDHRNKQNVMRALIVAYFVFPKAPCRQPKRKTDFNKKCVAYFGVRTADHPYLALVCECGK